MSSMPPLRTVRESLPSHGSSLSKNIRLSGVPLLDRMDAS
jgi:hypothetical protein